MKIHWLLPFKIDNLNQLKEVNSASIRLRLGTIIQNIGSSSLEVSAGENIVKNPEVLVIGKLKSNNDQTIKFWMDKIKFAKDSGAKIIIDYTDNYIDQLDSVFYKPFYDALIPIADKAITSSSYLKLNLNKHFIGQIEIIEDAIEVPIIRPQINNKLKNVLWFGHASNLSYLLKFVDQLKDFELLTNLHALTNEQGIEIANQSRIYIPKNLNIHLGIWSIESMINTAKFCDLCILPTNLNDIRKSGASSNRLITALALGLPTAADKLNSYNEFDSYFTDIRSEKFKDLIKEPFSFHNQVLEAQEKIVPNFTQKAISQKWIRFFSSLNQDH